MSIPFDAYLTNEELEAALRRLVDAHPHVAELRKLGLSHEGRAIHLVVIANRETGPDVEKPGFWIDGNIHATELTASMAALHVIQTVLERYGADPQVTELVDHCALYVVPRLNPDGAALALAEQPRFVRSGTRAYPRVEHADGLHAMDIDGDGRIRQMRIPDAAGDWKVADGNPKLMVKRAPHETGGTYYRVLPEGRIENYDGHLIRIAEPFEGLDFNRNFPVGWRPEGLQKGAGDYPGSEPEIQAVLSFVAEHRNLFGALTFHTYSRVILRPFSDRPDDDLPLHDKRLLEAIGEIGTELTGYPCVSVYHHFRYHPQEVITGVFDDWLFDHRGVLAFTVELWDLATAAGITHKNDEKQFIEWFRSHPVADDERIAAWVEDNIPDGLTEWEPYDHPQLGAVEIGGWNAMYTWRNPPPHLLEAEIAPHSDSAIAFASLAPRLEWAEVTVRDIGDGAFFIVAVVENRGFLGTYGTEQAKRIQASRPVRAELSLPGGARLLSGEGRAELGHLEGRANKLSTAYSGSSPTDNRAKAEWVVAAPHGTTVDLTVRSEMAGVLRRRVSLDPVT